MYNFSAGEILLVDKPYKWTSFDAVNKLRWHLRRLYNVKKFKVGHAGTLDPLATGLLVICTGKATKNIPNLTNDDKAYTGTFLLGKTTPCYDLEKPFDDIVYETAHITDALMNEVVQSFLGQQEQYPPIFSAKQIDGKRAYDLARAGKEVEMKPNIIEIKEFTIETTRFPEVDFYIKCSKGTYIRSIAHDFGQKLQSGATLIALNRVQSGDFKLENAKSVDEWIEIINTESQVIRSQSQMP
ncbi:MAG: tRNA pseudouridine(55) synthase TruB [Crocinitomicaceae bacterium]|nr:tRNA pseudouridine(55) synthase TruB [Crocinitomicaceae bacterium]